MSTPISSIFDYLVTEAQKNPDKRLFAEKKNGNEFEFISIKDFLNQVLQASSFLKKVGLEAGDNIGIILPVCTEWEVFHFAILHSRGVVVGLSPYDSETQLQWITEQSQLKGLIIPSNEYLEKFEQHTIESCKFIITLEAVSSKLQKYKNLKQWSYKAEAKDSFAGTIVSSSLPSDPATIIYTSGTTSEPKGIAYNHRQLTDAYEAISEVITQGHNPNNWRTICWLPLANLFQRVLNLCAMRLGAIIYLVNDPRNIVSELPEVSPHVFIAVPRFYQKVKAAMDDKISELPLVIRILMKASISLAIRNYRRQNQKKRKSITYLLLFPIIDALFFKKLRSIFGNSIQFMYSGSAPLDRTVQEFFHAIGLPLLEAYGMSENIIPNTMASLNAHKPGSVGKALSLNTIKVDPSGEILVKGSGIFKGYLHKEKDLNKWNEEGFYKTGDFGRLDEDGFLYLEGRRSDFIKTSTGRRISPGKIESVYRELPFVEYAIAVGWNRKCITLILVVNEEHPWFTSMLQNLKPGRELWSSAKLQKEITKLLSQKGEQLAEHDAPVGALIFKNMFSIDGGELTGNLKVRRQAIEEKYKYLVDKLYKTLESQNTHSFLSWLISEEEIAQSEIASLPVIYNISSSLFSRLRTIIYLLLIYYRFYFKHLLFKRSLTKEEIDRDIYEIATIIKERVGGLKGPLMKVFQVLEHFTPELPETVADALQSLRTTSPTIHPDTIRSVVEKELGKPIEDIFESWSDTPIASASIAQIHTAILPGGKKVAVKVQFPKIKKVVHLDLQILRFLAPIFSLFTPVRNGKLLVSELHELISKEYDFTIEARRQERFRKLFSHDQELIIPKVYNDYSTSKILTMEYISGKTFKEFSARATQDQKNKAAKIIWKIFSIAVNKHHIHNADPHPGNFLFKEGKVCLLDFGFCKEWSSDFMHLWIKQTLAGYENDLDTFKETSIALGFVGSKSELDYKELLLKFQEIFYPPWMQNSDFSFSKELSRKQIYLLFKEGLGAKDIEIPPDFVAVTRLFLGVHSMLAELNATGNWHEDVIPLLYEQNALYEESHSNTQNSFSP